MFGKLLLLKDPLLAYAWISLAVLNGHEDEYGALPALREQMNEQYIHFSTKLSIYWRELYTKQID